jgi:hypothetical protein
MEDIPKDMFEVEAERIKSFHLQVDHYRKHLNQVLKLDFQEITKEAAEAYLKKAVGRAIRKLTTGTDVIALISVIGELVKEDAGGKWFLSSHHSVFSPHNIVYEPSIITGAGNVFFISGCIMSMIKWKVSSLDTVFIRAHSVATVPIKWQAFSKLHKNLIVLE